MTNDHSLVQPVDRSRIELIEDNGLRFWTLEFQCSAEHLLDAIEAVGADPAAVGDYLAMRRYAGAAIAQGQTRNSTHSNQHFPS